MNMIHLKNNWPIKKLGEIAKIYQGGKSGLTKKDYVKSGFSAFSAMGQDGFTKKAFDSGSAVILSSIGARCGKCFYAEGKWTALANTQVIKPDNPITAKFLYYYLNDENKWPRYGSAQPFIAPSTVKRLKVPFPPLKIQQKIVERLDAIKKAQELNDKQIELAEELFQGLLHCELDPKGKNWEVKRLGDITKIESGGTPSTKKTEYWNGDILWLTPKELSNFKGIEIYDTERKITKLGLDHSSAKILPIGTVLLTSRAPIGYVAIAGKPMATNQGFKNFICDKKLLNNKFLYYFLKNKTKEIQSLGRGATFGEVSKGIVSNIKIPLPPLETQKKIVEKLSAVQEYKKKLLDQKQKLQELFESVLDKSLK